jgi:Mce-associated membrane protein
MAGHARTAEHEVTETVADSGQSIATATPSADDLVVPADDGDGQDDDAQTDDGPPDDPADADLAEEPAKSAKSNLTLMTAAGVVFVIVLGSLVGWLGFRFHQARQAEDRHDLFLQVGRQAAINLTTIDYSTADHDVQRILDSATGTFHDDFSQRSQPFIDTVTQAQSKSVGTVTEAGVESETADDAQVLVALNVKTSLAGNADQPPRGWRMRVILQRIGDQVKVSNVEFVP